MLSSVPSTRLDNEHGRQRIQGPPGRLARNANYGGSTDSRFSFDVNAGQSYSVLVPALGKHCGDYTAAFD